MNHLYKIVLITVITTFLCASCTTQKKAYNPKRYRKNDCNCSSWSFYNVPDKTSKSAS